MGCTSAKQESNQSQTIDQTQKTTFAPRTPQEEAVLSQLSGLGTAQKDALMQQIQSLTGGASPFGLSPADQELLNQRYKSAEEQLALQGKDYADYLSGGRGLRMSDSPISSQALQRYGLGQSALQSEKANASLGLGLQGNQFRMNSVLGLAGATPSGLVSAFNPMFQERLAGGTQQSHTTGQTRGTTFSTPSLMSSIGQGIGIAGQLGSMAMPFLAPGVGSLGSGAAASAASGGGYGGGMGLTGSSVGNMFGPGY